MSLPPRLAKKPKRDSRWRSQAATMVAVQCDQCGSTVEKRLGEVNRAKRRGSRLFCDRACSSKASCQDHLAHFAACIQPSSNGCWEWGGSIMSKGYGVIHKDGRRMYAHRYSYELHHGPCGELHVLHSCDNPRCVNPQHLRLGTHQDNMTDAKERNRLRPHRGEGHHAAKLNAEQVNFIRSSPEKGSVLAERFRVARTTIYAIRSGQNWGHK